jgi:argininosuccinate lyase
MEPSASVPAYVHAPSVPFLNSIAMDRHLARYDVAGSIAHAEMLGRTGLVSPEESARIVAGLRTIAIELDRGTFPWREELEDVHTNVEVRLGELIGPVGGKLHTARSRNDQVALDERLFLRSEVHDLGGRVGRLLTVLIDRAEREAEIVVPGYTHLQRAQPITLGHYWLAHHARFERDLERLLATAARADVSPLGAGALAGSTLPIDPAWTAERLGFARPFSNSLDAVSDRDPFVELTFDIALCLVHASALAEEIVLHASAEFGFLERTGELGAGSSQMPQKRNPDVAELVRAKAARAVGDLTSELVLLKGLPLAYDRDLQEDKPPVADAIATARSVLEALLALVPSLRYDPVRLEAAAHDPELYVTDRAEALVQDGVPFRTAHERLASAPRSSDPTSPPPDPVQAIARRASPGGPAPASVHRQLAEARERLAGLTDSLSSLGRKVELVEELLKENHR